MEAACHKDRGISKKAVQCIHDSMAALLNEQVELPHFHFNEALFKPFENLLCLELCDSDVQDQVSLLLSLFFTFNLFILLLDKDLNTVLQNISYLTLYFSTYFFIKGENHKIFVPV